MSSSQLAEQVKTIIIGPYAENVRLKHPDLVNHWPVISGFDLVAATFKGWWLIGLRHTGNTAAMHVDVIGELSEVSTGVPEITETNQESVRMRIATHFNLAKRDALVLNSPQGLHVSEYDKLMQRHEHAMGLTPMKLFLSHKTADKPLVRQFKQVLVELGFDPWLDEDAMNAGALLERALLKGFADSCAAIFFVTPNYKDDGYLATEVDYAVSEKRKKGDRFEIVTLVLADEQGRKGDVPDLLKRFVYKEPASQLTALSEIIKAIPVTVGAPYWRR